jgi:hypothetical protein
LDCGELLDEGWGCDDVADAEACEAPGLGEAADDDEAGELGAG